MKKWSLWYWIAGWWIFSGLMLFHRKMKFVWLGKNHLDGPVIFAPNHQNAFMDAVATVVSLHRRKQTGFMVRGDIFTNKLAAAALRSLKMFPAYRMRDGIENVRKIDDTLEDALFLLNNKNGLLIFPEADHDVPRRLRPLKKGISRTAFQFEAENNWEAGLRLVPVGINYTDPHHPGGDVLVIYGEPFYLSEYREIFEEQPAKAYTAVIKRLQQEMRPLMIDIRTSEYYDTVEEIRTMASNRKLGRKPDPLKRFEYQKEVIDALDPWMENHREGAEELSKKVNEIRKGRDHMNLADWKFNKPNFNVGTMLLEMLMLVILFPVFLVGAATHALQVIYPYRLIDRKVGDIGFRSSMKLTSSMVIFLLQYLILLIVLPLVISPWYLGLGIVAGLFISGLVALAWINFYQRLKGQMKYNAMASKNDGEFLRIRNLREEVLDQVDRIMASGSGQSG